MKRFLFCFAVSILWCSIVSAVPISKLLTWEGDAGYSAKVWFSYDPGLALVGGDALQDPNFAVGIDDMAVAFYAPGGSLLASGATVTSGTLVDWYFKFAFDTATIQLAPGVSGNMGVGGGLSIWLGWSDLVVRGMSLATDYSDGRPKTLDCGMTYSIVDAPFYLPPEVSGYVAFPYDWEPTPMTTGSCTSKTKVPDTGSTTTMLGFSLVGLWWARKRLIRR